MSSVGRAIRIDPLVALMGMSRTASNPRFCCAGHALATGKQGDQFRVVNEPGSYSVVSVGSNAREVSVGHPMIGSVRLGVSPTFVIIRV